MVRAEGGVAVIVLQWLTALLLLLGAILGFLAAVGVLRFPDTLVRMQASSKASTLGLACLLAGTALQFPEVSVIIRLGSIAAFVMLTAPLTAHIIARVTLHRRTPLWEHTVLNEHEPDQCASEDEGANARG
ncbi:monovalent cation/H(+) antiporter subunit G [Sorangium sp. So ce1036]|uniref:monovalent cation/H(+) antiporter subunit G n=1 Tax=Sorangium sp. So ce1036 TaxID=3133328 RepID=UPI003EFFD68A